MLGAAGGRGGALVCVSGQRQVILRRAMHCGQVHSRGVETEELRAAAASLERTAESNAAQIRALEGQVTII